MYSAIYKTKATTPTRKWNWPFNFTFDSAYVADGRKDSATATKQYLPTKHSFAVRADICMSVDNVISGIFLRGFRRMDNDNLKTTVHYYYTYKSPGSTPAQNENSNLH